MVHHRVVEQLTGFGHLGGGDSETIPNVCFGRVAPRAETSLQLFDRWGDDEDHQGIGSALTNLSRPLDLDVEKDVLTSFERGFDRGRQCPVVVVVVHGPLEQ
jgi:hypothetical protein